MIAPNWSDTKPIVACAKLTLSAVMAPSRLQVWIDCCWMSEPRSPLRPKPRLASATRLRRPTRRSPARARVLANRAPFFKVDNVNAVCLRMHLTRRNCRTPIFNQSRSVAPKDPRIWPVSKPKPRPRKPPRPIVNKLRRRKWALWLSNLSKPCNWRSNFQRRYALSGTKPIAWSAIIPKWR